MFARAALHNKLVRKNAERIRHRLAEGSDQLLGVIRVGRLMCAICSPSGSGGGKTLLPHQAACCGDGNVAGLAYVIASGLSGSQGRVRAAAWGHELVDAAGASRNAGPCGTTSPWATPIPGIVIK